ncbi:MAG TPA: hypothetical protein VM098_04455, partial [Phycisphaerae bacterium]|nr:hypothetical protein [Phycisphaerae bacterium]
LCTLWQMYTIARAAVRAAGEMRRKNKKIFSVGIILMGEDFPLVPLAASPEMSAFARANVVTRGKYGGTARGKSGRLEDWKNGRLEDWKIGRVVDWKTGRVEDWKIGRMEEWKIAPAYPPRRAGISGYELRMTSYELRVTHGFFANFELRSSNSSKCSLTTE